MTKCWNFTTRYPTQISLDTVRFKKAHTHTQQQQQQPGDHSHSSIERGLDLRSSAVVNISVRTTNSLS